MVAITFDTLIYSKKLRAAGVSEQVAEVQAEALAEVIDDHLVTKKDLLDTESRLTHQLEKLSYKLAIRLGGMIIAGVLVLAAIIKL